MDISSLSSPYSSTKSFPSSSTNSFRRLSLRARSFISTRNRAFFSCPPSRTQLLCFSLFLLLGLLLLIFGTIVVPTLPLFSSVSVPEHIPPPTSLQFTYDINTAGTGTVSFFHSFFSSAASSYSSREGTNHTQEAYVVYLPIMDDYRYFVQGAILLRQLALREYTNRSFVVLYGEEVPRETVTKYFGFIGVQNLQIRQIKTLGIDPRLSDKKVSNTSLVYGRLFSKLHIYTLVEFERVLYLDVDFIVRSVSPARMMSRQDRTIGDTKGALGIWELCPAQVSLCAGRDVGVGEWYINAGMLMIRPDAGLFSQMSGEIARGVDANLVYAEQDYLNLFYDRHKSLTRYILRSRAELRYMSMRVGTSAQEEVFLIHHKMWNRMHPHVAAEVIAQYTELWGFIKTFRKTTLPGRRYEPILIQFLGTIELFWDTEISHLLKPASHIPSDATAAVDYTTGQVKLPETAPNEQEEGR